MPNKTSAPIRLAVARLWYEGNAFSPVLADGAAFERREWLRGEAALAATASESELRAVADFAGRHDDWDVTVLRCASASPAGPMDEAVFSTFQDELLADLEVQPYDALYLSLHGASITTARDTPELDLLHAIRERHPALPVGASFDLHGNLPPEIAPLLDAASVYRTYPHIDMRETAARVLTMLERKLAGEITPVCHVLAGGLLLPSFNMLTARGPMHDLISIAEELRREPGVLEVGVFGGFPFANTPQTSASSLVVVDGDEAKAARVACSMSDAIAARAKDFMVTLASPAAGIAQALEANIPGLIAVTDPGDNPYSGGINDTPEMLRALIAAKPQVECVFASITDPELVVRAFAAGAGAELDAVSLGGKAMPHYGAPVVTEAKVLRLTDGAFRNTGPMEHGLEMRCGRSAVLGIGHIRIIVTEFVAPANDPAFFALHGVDLDTLRLLCVKAKNHFRAAFEPLCARIIEIDAPGPACLDMRKLPFRPELQERVAAAYRL